ncbi:MAG: epoxyqueuosine reductase QueH [Bacilli bacterium]|nr:epoxyqueuosine reductase QueH [Bacilli bacterium]
MNESYYKLCLEELSKIDKPKRLLLHSCCAPCSSHVISFLTNYFDITILYYNPNISPIEEYNKRKEEQIRLIKEIDKTNKIDIIDCDYDNNIYEKSIKGYEKCPERGDRCTICFNLRLDKTAKVAKENNYDYFCSTLTVSPYKNSILINEIGKKMEEKYSIKWLYSDFKKDNGYKHSIELSKKYNLYRQNYCGCKYSVREKKYD